VGLSRLLDGFPEGLLAQLFLRLGRVRSLLTARFNGLPWIALAGSREKDAKAPSLFPCPCNQP
jgi:hypothetical protein